METTPLIERLKVEWISTHRPYHCYVEYNLRVTALNTLLNNVQKLETICGYAGFSGQGFRIINIEKISIDQYNYYTVYCVEIYCYSSD